MPLSPPPPPPIRNPKPNNYANRKISTAKEEQRRKSNDFAFDCFSADFHVIFILSRVRRRSTPSHSVGNTEKMKKWIIIIIEHDDEMQIRIPNRYSEHSICSLYVRLVAHFGSLFNFGWLNKIWRGGQSGPREKFWRLENCGGPWRHSICWLVLFTFRFCCGFLRFCPFSNRSPIHFFLAKQEATQCCDDESMSSMSRQMLIICTSARAACKMVHTHRMGKQSAASSRSVG